MIIDAHTHFYDPFRPEGVPWPRTDNDLLYRTVLPEHWRVVAEPHGVTATIVVEASPWLEDNQWILDLARRDQSIVGLVGHIDPGHTAFADHLARFASDDYFCGVRVNWTYLEDIDRGNFIGKMELLVSRDLELDVLGGVDMLPGVDALARRLPELRIVINHIAGLPIDGEAPDAKWCEDMAKVAEHPRVYCKVSALVECSTIQPAPSEVGFYTPMLDELWEAFGENRLVYGSNWPVSDSGADYSCLFGIVASYFSSKGDVAREKYFCKNALKAYGCKLQD